MFCSYRISTDTGASSGLSAIVEPLVGLYNSPTRQPAPYKFYNDDYVPFGCANSSDLSNRARHLYKNIAMLFLFPVKDGKLSTGVIAQRFLSCYF